MYVSQLSLFTAPAVGEKVYFTADGDEFIKIGKTQGSERDRLRAFQTGNLVSFGSWRCCPAHRRSGCTTGSRSIGCAASICISAPGMNVSPKLALGSRRSLRTTLAWFRGRVPGRNPYPLHCAPERSYSLRSNIQR
jgi:hypothetical protein